MPDGSATPQTLTTSCVIAGGGLAGMMLGFLLARAGVEVIVLEKHKDFLRDFRGDTIHPSTLTVMHELGLLDEFLKRPHQEVRELSVMIGSETARIADFTHVPGPCKFLAFMPQWDFLDFLAEHAKRYPTFHLMMRAEVTDLLEEEDRVSGLRVRTSDGQIEIHARLTVGADGRHSLTREKSGLAVDNLGAPVDVLWFRLPRRLDDHDTTFGRVDAGHIMVLIDRGDYWQCAFVIPKGDTDALKQKGLPHFRDMVAGVLPRLADRVDTLKDWDDVKLLTVTVDRLRQWCKPGLLCIGDAAHAMSPVGGVGINLAIQDAVAAANILAPVLRYDYPTLDQLWQVQRRRELPARLTQAMQLAIQNNIMTRVLALTEAPKAPGVIRLLDHSAYLRRFPARAVGIGFRPEHVKTEELKPASPAQ